MLVIFHYGNESTSHGKAGTVQGVNELLFLAVFGLKLNVSTTGLKISAVGAGRNLTYFAAIPLSEIEKKLIIKNLNQSSGNRTKTTERLSISIRTLRNKLNDYKKHRLVRF
ncbi:hypothetical protein D0S45_14015 [Marinifilum sp. JC120]|nr:hypothetical protein D0S45_14015 [Marinifilum sp. JC120]